MVVCAPLVAQGDARIHTVPIRDGVAMLEGRGGNIGVCYGEDGTFLIDDQFAPMVPQIRAAVARLTDTTIRFVINTHHHGDHTGGNERFGRAGAVIVAHENVRKRMSAQQLAEGGERAAGDSKALPVVTFAGGVTLHLNGDDVQIFHVSAAHTDGDAIVWFRRGNVIHMGDVFFNGAFPYIDLDSGGTLHGLIAAVDRVLEIADGETAIIPGHGKLTDRDGLRQYREVLGTIHARFADLVRDGKTLDEVRAAKPTAEWDATWGTGFMKPDRFQEIVYRSVRAELDARK